MQKILFFDAIFSQIYVSQNIKTSSLQNGSQNFPFENLSTAFEMNQNLNNNLDFILIFNESSFDFLEMFPLNNYTIKIESSS